MVSEAEQRRILERQAEARTRELEDAGKAIQAESNGNLLSAEQSYMSTLRLLIVGFLIIWLMVTVVSLEDISIPST